jgi:hypothetical protein
MSCPIRRRAWVDSGHRALIAIPLMLALGQAAAAFDAPAASDPAQAGSPARGVVIPLPSPPEDWSQLPELRLKRRQPDPGALSFYVRDEIRAGRCAAESPLRVDLAVLIAATGQLRRIRPNAIGCPTVEQYASGLVMRMARGNVSPPLEDRWYRISLTFAWQ